MSTRYEAISITFYFRSFLQHWVMTAFTQSTKMGKITPPLLEEKRRDYFSSSIISAFIGTQASSWANIHIYPSHSCFVAFLFLHKNDIADIKWYWISELRSLLKVIFQIHLFYKLVQFQIVLRILCISIYYNNKCKWYTLIVCNSVLMYSLV